MRKMNESKDRYEAIRKYVSKFEQYKELAGIYMGCLDFETGSNVRSLEDFDFRNIDFEECGHYLIKIYESSVRLSELSRIALKFGKSTGKTRKALIHLARFHKFYSESLEGLIQILDGLKNLKKFDEGKNELE